MPLLAKARSFLRNIFLVRRVESDLAEELRSHLEMLTEENIRRGMPPHDAERAARIELGGIEQVNEQVREVQIGNWLHSILADCRFFLRQLRKSPGSATATILTLTLGIGANSAIFTVIDAVMLRDLEVEHPEQLVAVGNPARVHSWSGGTPRTDIFSFPLYREVRDNNTVFSSVLACSQLQNLRIKIEGGAENITGRLVTENYFQTLGVKPLIGRVFTAEEGRAPGADPLLVISYGYWRRRFAGDPGIIGTRVRLNNYPFTIIGVAPPAFVGEVVGDRPDAWVPMMMQAQLMPGREFLEDANIAAVLLIGRLRPGTSVEQARVNVNAVVERALRVTLGPKITSDDRDAIRKMNIAVQVSPGRRGLSRLREQFSTPLLLLMAMVMLVLLVACVNVANVMIARSAGRKHEIAIRFALGARSSRIARQLLTESLLLALVGGALGVLFANWGSAWLVSLASPHSGARNALSLGVDWRVLGFTGAICLSAAALFGLAPTLRVLSVQLGGPLKEAARLGRGAKSDTRYALAISQIALGVLVLMASSLLIRSLRNLEEFNLGYSRDQLLIVPVDLLSGGYKGAAVENATEELLSRFGGLAGVRSVTASSNGLFNGNESSDAIVVDGVLRTIPHDNVVADDEVAPNYFSTIGAPILLGREITEEDFSTAARVVVVNESFAKFYFPGRNPLGHRVLIQASEHPDQPPYEIIGVARDVRDHGVRDPARRRIYAPLTSATFDEPDLLNFEIRAVGNPKMLINAVRTAARTLNPDLAVGNIETAGELVSDSLTPEVVVSKLSSFFGLLVLTLICVGLYGSMAYNVAARTKEIGLRLALGALEADVIWMVIREASGVLLTGLALGMPLGIAASHWFRAMLFGVSNFDPLSIGSAILTLIASCMIAAIAPVRRATRVDPMITLRYE